MGVAFFINSPETLFVGIAVLDSGAGPLVLHANDSAAEVRVDAVLLLSVAGAIDGKTVNGRSVAEAVTSVHLIAVVSSGETVIEEIDSFVALVLLVIVCGTGVRVVVTASAGPIVVVSSLPCTEDEGAGSVSVWFSCFPASIALVGRVEDMPSEESLADGRGQQTSGKSPDQPQILGKLVTSTA